MALRGEALGLNVFAYGSRLDRKLRRQHKLKDFSGAMEEQLVGQPEPLAKITITYLYETCLRARAEIEIAKAAKQVVRGSAWRRSKQAAIRLRDGLAAYQQNDIEKMIRSVVNRSGTKAKSQTGSTCKDLMELLDQFLQQAKRWEDAYRSSPLTAWYRDAIHFMDKYLRKKYPRFLKMHRIDVILVALNAFDLRGVRSSEPTTESISKLLYRPAPRKLYRFNE